jgi:prolyl oligopeptidase
MRILRLIFIGILLFSCSKQEKIVYPVTKKVDQVDDYHGTKVADPYRWLENDTAKDVAEWVDAQNKVTFDYLNKIPFKGKIKKRLEEVFNYPTYSSPFRVGEYYFFSKNDGLQNQAVYYFQKGLDGKPEVFLDPNKMSEDGTVAASFAGVSKDDKYIVVSISRSGSDWKEFQVMEVATKKILEDKLNWIKFSGASWYKDGFFYSSYGKPEKGKEFSKANEFHKVYYHKLGTKQENDKLVYEDKKHPKRGFYAQVSEDQKYLFVGEWEGTSGAGFLYKELGKKRAKLKRLFDGFANEYGIVDTYKGQFLVRTNVDAPNYRLVLVNPKKPAKKYWKNVIPEKEELLQSVGTAGGKLFASYLKDVTTQVFQYDYSGKLERQIELPGLGTASDFGGNKDDSSLFYSFSSFVIPNSIFKYDIASGKSELFKKAEVKVDFEKYETKQVFYESKDGTKVPMFIVHKKGIELDGNRPTMLYAYGGFNISVKPRFSSNTFVLLEQGGVYAVANIRGGGEYGEKWHKGGMLLKKQNVFDDFIAAGEYLIKNKYTSNKKLAIRGGSNGGLLVGAVMTQRPDLFKVAFPAVGVLDMLRYHKFTIGWAWAVEYGSSEDKTHFDNIYKYSPLHNLKKVAYPATMITTADHDDRVVPAHSFKFAAALQEHHTGDLPVFIRISKKAGHGAGKPISKIIEESADMWAFMFHNMGIEYK